MAAPSERGIAAAKVEQPLTDGAEALKRDLFNRAQRPGMLRFELVDVKKKKARYVSLYQITADEFDRVMHELNREGALAELRVDMRINRSKPLDAHSVFWIDNTVVEYARLAELYDLTEAEVRHELNTFFNRRTA